MANASKILFQKMTQDIMQDSTIPAESKLKIVQSLETVMSPLLQDKWIYRMVVGFLGLVVVLTVVGGFIIVLTGNSASIPEGIIAIGSAAIGALAGLLAPSPNK
jgi:hypothetical protein